jgi:hypothetical protein
MKNILTFILAGILVLATLGCGLVSRIQEESGGSSNSNKTLGDKAVDVAVGDTKIGIKECDDVVEILNEQINDPDESFVTKALKRTVLNQFRDQLKRSLEDNKADKQAVGKFCADFKKNLIESASNSNTNKK